VLCLPPTPPPVADIHATDEALPLPNLLPPAPTVTGILLPGIGWFVKFLNPPPPPPPFPMVGPELSPPPPPPATTNTSASLAPVAVKVPLELNVVVEALAFTIGTAIPINPPFVLAIFFSYFILGQQIHPLLNHISLFILPVSTLPNL
jgi:hypothetical protein